MDRNKDPVDMQILDIPSDTMDIVLYTLARLDVRNLARVAAASKAMHHNLESVLLRRSSEREKEAAGALLLTPSVHRRVTMLVDHNHVGFLLKSSYLAWFDWITPMLGSKDSDDRVRALENISKQFTPVQLTRYADVVVHMMLHDESCHVQWRALKTLGKLESVELVLYARDIEFVLMSAYQSTEFIEMALEILCAIDPSIVVRIMIDCDEGEIKVCALRTLGTMELVIIQAHADDIANQIENGGSAEVVEAALHTLCKLQSSVLQHYAATVARVLRDWSIENKDVMLAALNTLGKLDIDVLEKYSDVIYSHVYSTRDIRDVAWQILRKLGPVVLEKYIGLVIRSLGEDEETPWTTRCMALETLAHIEGPALMKKYAKHVVDKLTDSYPFVRRTALETLSDVAPTDLNMHADEVVRLLRAPVEVNIIWRGMYIKYDYDEAAVRKQALRTLGHLSPTDLIRYADDVVNMLNDPAAAVREQALRTLYTLPPTDLKKHTDAVFRMLLDPSRSVRRIAVAAFGSVRVGRALPVPHI